MLNWEGLKHIKNYQKLLGKENHETVILGEAILKYKAK